MTPTSFQTQILSSTPASLTQVTQTLTHGGVVAIPTETVYGLAGHGFNEEALTKIFQAKERPTFDPLILHVPPTWNTLALLAEHKLIDLSCLSEPARHKTQALMNRFWPGPLTLVLPKHPQVPDLATSGLPTVALRMPQHPVTQALLTQCGFPLAAPSANRFGRISPTSAGDVLQELAGRISYILDGGPCTWGLESTILALDPDSGTFSLLRPGSTPQEELTRLTGPLSTAHSTSTLAPGSLPNHYAPHTPLFILPEPFHTLSGEQWQDYLAAHHLSYGPWGLLRFSGARLAAPQPFAQILTLSPTGDNTEAARHFFSSLRQLDNSGVVAIFADPVKDLSGLGHALFDRFKKAETK